jgi:hypothetical protein
MSAYLSVALPRLRCWDDGLGGGHFRASAAGRSFHAVLRRLPGRVVYVQDVCGVRQTVGWAVCDGAEDLSTVLTDLLSWAAGRERA